MFDGLVIDLNRESTVPPPDLTPEENDVGAHVGVGIFYLGAGVGGRGNRVVNSEIRGGWQIGLVLQRPDPVDVLDIEIENTRIHQCSGGVAIFQATATQVMSSTLEHNTRVEEPKSNGISIVHSGDISLSGCSVIENGRHGILFQSCWDFRVIDRVSNGNGFDPGAGRDHYGWGIVVGRGGDHGYAHDNSTNFVISNNQCHDNWRSGITPDPTKHDENWLPQNTMGAVVGNVCSSSGEAGVHGIQLNRTDNVTVVGNMCYGMPNSGIVVTRATNVLVAGNIINSVAAAVEYGHHVVGPNHSYGNGREDLSVVETNQVDVAVLEPRERLALSAPHVGFFGAPPAPKPAAYDVQVTSTDRSYDAAATEVSELANVLGTLIADLRSLGLIG